MSTNSLTVGVAYPALVGKVLTKRREGRGWDQAKMSQLVGLSRSTWSRIENGESALTMDQLAKAAEVLGVAPHEILADADKAQELIVDGGLKVVPERNNAGLTLLAGAALALLVANALK
ncbi:MAG: helix-turn-helix transcriptional regulator [Rhodospirillaceae bacterium]|nr:helix-turn-helix transcriptional regulator [Rhodospirillales bacterium]